MKTKQSCDSSVPTTAPAAATETAWVGEIKAALRNAQLIRDFFAMPDENVYRKRADGICVVLEAMLAKDSGSETPRPMEQQRDTERLDWLESDDRLLTLFTKMQNDKSKASIWHDQKCLATGDTPRAAIDTAMSLGSGVHAEQTRADSLQPKTNPSPAPATATEGLASRFSKDQSELAQKIANDIHEDIDCGESRKQLRMAVDYWSCVATDEANRKSSEESQAVISALEKLSPQPSATDEQIAREAAINLHRSLRPGRCYQSK
jgi:hypothetical protein